MQATARPRVKVCCIQSEAEAWMAIRAGASALGLVSAMPSGPGPIPDDLIASIAGKIPPGIASFLLTCCQNVEGIVEQQRGTGVNAIQLVDRLERGTYADLRAAMPGIALVQVIHVTGEESLEEARSIAPHVNALLLDSGNPTLAVKELGGTGRVHDWTVSRRIRDAVDVPIFLAGGLTPENVRAAIDQVAPFGLDICSGLRTDGHLDPARLDGFFTAIGTGCLTTEDLRVPLRPLW